MPDFDLMERQALATAALYRFLRETRGTGGILLMVNILNNCAAETPDASESINEAARKVRAVLDDAVGRDAGVLNIRTSNVSSIIQ
jgi:hypothetical protein